MNYYAISYIITKTENSEKREYIKLIWTDDIYHEIGKLVCKCFDPIGNVSFYQFKIEEYFLIEINTLKYGFTKLKNGLFRRVING